MERLIKYHCRLLVVGVVLLAGRDAGHALQVNPERDAACPPGTKVLFAYSARGVVSCAAVLQESRFDLDNVRRISMSWLKSLRSPVLAELVIAPNEIDLRQSYFGTNVGNEAEPSYCDSLEQMPRARRGPKSAIARILALGDGALFSYRADERNSSKGGDLVEQVVAGRRDPTKLLVHGKALRLLHFSVKRSSRNEHSVVLFFRSSSPPECKTALQAVRDIRQRVGGRDWEAWIRTDIWFSSEFFPLFFRFASNEERITHIGAGEGLVAPKAAPYYRRPQLNLADFHGRVVCDAYGRYDHLQTTSSHAADERETRQGEVGAYRGMR